jgi:asparaginyl-tRNA synthetase
MTERTEIKQLFKNYQEWNGRVFHVTGWVRTIRSSSAIGFIELNDGSYFRNVQVVFENDKIENFKEVEKLNVGASIRVTGVLEVTVNMKQPFELKAREIIIEGESSPAYPLQKKRHSFEYLRTIAHLRPRTNTFSAVFRVDFFYS